MLKPAGNCWRLCALLQLAPSSGFSSVLTLLAVPELLIPWTEKPEVPGGADHALLKLHPALSALVLAAALLQSVRTNTLHPRLLRSITLLRELLSLEAKISGAKGYVSTPKSQHGSREEGKACQIPRMKPHLPACALRYNTFYCCRKRTFSNQAVARENLYWSRLIQ